MSGEDAGRSLAMDFRITAYVASGVHGVMCGTCEFYRASEAECIRAINDVSLIPLPVGDWGELPRVVGAVYHKRSGNSWRLIDRSETLDKDWSNRPLRGQP